MPASKSAKAKAPATKASSAKKTAAKAPARSAKAPAKTAKAPTKAKAQAKLKPATTTRRRANVAAPISNAAATAPASPAKAKKAPPVRPASPALAAQAEKVELPSLVKWLAGKTDEPRMEKAIRMLKAGSFQLFSEVTETEIVGVVHSQKANLDKFYSSQIKSDGHFCCADQNMELCMGMNGFPCKHLMVLMVGLAQGGKVSPATIKSWVNKAVTLSFRERIHFDQERLSATFIKFKGAQAGELDWRPTETIPEDYYAL